MQWARAFSSTTPKARWQKPNQLEANILRDGRIINPIIVWEGLIVDGHNRFIIAKKHPEIPFTVHEKPTAAEIASVARAPPEERPALVAEICKPKDQKKAAMTRTTPPPAAKPLSDSSTSEEESTDEELVHTPAPQEQTFPQRVNEPLKIDRQQILEIANSRYVPKRLADGTAMLCEVSGAANSMMRRWESVFREYPDILSDAENRASVGRTIQKLRDYLNNLEDKMEELL